MTTPTPGTIPALTEYQPGALTIASTVNVEIVQTVDADTAASYRMSQTDFVGKAPSVMVAATPLAGDLIAFYQVANNLPVACNIGTLGLTVGNLPAAGSTGTILQKNSGTNYDASWVNISTMVGTAAGITRTGSTSITLGIQTAGIVSSMIATNAVGSTQFRQSTGLSLVGVVGTATANVSDVTASNATHVMRMLNATTIGWGAITTTLLPAPFQVGAFTSWGVAITNATGALTGTNFGTTGMFLMGNGSAGAPSFGLVNLGASTSVTGTTAITSGGTGTNVLGVFGVMLGGTTTVGVVAATTLGLVMIAQNATTAPAFGVAGYTGGGTGTTNLTTPFGVVLGGTTSLGLTAAGATGTLLSGSTATSAPAFRSVSLILDTVNTTQGTLLYRSNASWLGLAAATAGYILQTVGTASDPQWVGSGGTLLNTITANQLGSAVDTTSFTSRYSRYRVTFENVAPVSTATLTCSLNMQVATTGASWVSSGYVSYIPVSVGLTTVMAGTTSLIYLSGTLATTTPGTSAAAYGVFGAIEISNINISAARKYVTGQVTYQTAGASDTTTLAIAYPSGYLNVNGAITGIAVAFQTGNIATGTIKVYGII